MTVPYNLLPIETHLAMITAQQASVPVLEDAARMWTEVRQWIETTRTELNNKVNTMSPHWTDDAGRALEEKLQRTLAELNAWGEQIDGSNVVSNLTTLAGAIPEAQAEVSGLYQSYLAAISNPFTAPAALAIQQASGARMTALGGQFDTSMLTVCAATGVKSPADLVPGLNNGSSSGAGVSASDAAKTADDATSALSALQSLDSGLTGGSGSANLSGLNGNLPSTDSSGSMPNLSDLTSGTGPSLAGLTPTLPTDALLSTGVGGLPGGFAGLTGLSGSGTPPMASGLSALPMGALGGAGGLPMAMGPVASKQASGAAEEVQPGYAGPVGAMPMGAAGMGAGAGGGRPGPGVQTPAGAGRGRRAAAEQDGVLAALRGRAGTGESAGFTLARPHGDAFPGPAAQPLDEELWRVD